MKTLRTFTLLLALALAATAARAAVDVVDLSNIRLDGVNAGSFESVRANYPAQAAEVATAVLAWLDAHPTAAAIARVEAAGITVPQSIKDKVPAS
jgi:hypothetical protein